MSFAKALNDLELIRTATAHMTPWSRSELISSPQAFPQIPLPITLNKTMENYLQPFSEFQTGSTYKQVLESSNYNEKNWKKTPYPATFSLEDTNFV